MKLSKKAKAALQSEFAQYISAIAFSDCQLRKIEGERGIASADYGKELKRNEELKKAQLAIGAKL